jgi:DNA-binding LacI/PurR family transcriptional regulator/PAS domain-containing protein
MNNYLSSYEANSPEATAESGRPDRKITLGYLAVNIHDNVGSAIFDGISAQCRENGINLVTFKGEKVGNPEIGAPNFIYEMASRRNIDGLIVWPVTLAYDTRKPEYLGYYKKFLDLPVVCIGMNTPETPSVTIDNFHGIKLILEHLVRQHQTKKIAYINASEGHAYSDARFAVYRKHLKEYGLEYDERLVSPFADFSEQTGRAAIDHFITEHRLVPGEDIEAIVTASDVIAAGAMRRLEELGFRIPEDVIVTGFNNTLISRAIYPGITTVEPNFTDHGRKVVEILRSMIEGKSTPKSVQMPVRAVIRQSCGCLGETAEYQLDQLSLDKTGNESDRETGECVLKPFTPENAGSIVATLQQCIRTNNEEQKAILSDMFNAFIKDLLYYSNKNFLGTYARIINSEAGRDSIFPNLYNILNLMRRKLFSFLPDEKMKAFAETLLHNARMITDSKFESVKEEMRSQQIILSDSLPAFGAVLSAMNDYRSLFGAFEKMLVKIGIRECFISLFENEDHTSGYSRLFFAFSDGKRKKVSETGYRFETGELIPKGYDEEDRRTNRIFLPLYYNQYMFGFIACEFSDYLRSIYGSVARILSSALFGLKVNGERERTHATILESEIKFRSMIETSNDWIWEVDENLIYKYSSPRLKDITGYDQEDGTGGGLYRPVYLQRRHERPGDGGENFGGHPLQGIRGSGPIEAGHHQSFKQCAEIYGKGTHPADGRTGSRRGGEGRRPLQCGGYGDRYKRRGYREALCGFQPGRCVHEPEIRGHRTGPVHFPTAGEYDERLLPGGEQARKGFLLLLYREIRGSRKGIPGGIPPADGCNQGEADPDLPGGFRQQPYSLGVSQGSRIGGFRHAVRG